MHDEIIRMRKAAAAAAFDVLSQNLPVGTEENYGRNFWKAIGQSNLGPPKH
jgi:hypothetical protein